MSLTNITPGSPGNGENGFANFGGWKVSVSFFFPIKDKRQRERRKKMRKKLIQHIFRQIVLIQHIFCHLGETIVICTPERESAVRTIAKQQTVIEERVLSFSSDNSELIDS